MSKAEQGQHSGGNAKLGHVFAMFEACLKLSGDGPWSGPDPIDLAKKRCILTQVVTNRDVLTHRFESVCFCGDRILSVNGTSPIRTISPVAIVAGQFLVRQYSDGRLHRCYGSICSKQGGRLSQPRARAATQGVLLFVAPCTLSLTARRTQISVTPPSSTRLMTPPAASQERDNRCVRIGW